MSLTVFLEDDSGRDIYRANITHNLAEMARQAGLYTAIWRPEEISEEPKAYDLIGPTVLGLNTLISRPGVFERFEPANKWGSYEELVLWVIRYLEALRINPGARVQAFG